MQKIDKVIEQHGGWPGAFAALYPSGSEEKRLLDAMLLAMPG